MAAFFFAAFSAIPPECIDNNDGRQCGDQQAVLF